MVIDDHPTIEFLSGLSDFFKKGKKFGYKAYPPPWMNDKQRSEYFRGKSYAISQLEDRSGTHKYK